MNILTFDIEEWFHILDNESTDSIGKWDRFPCRIHENMDRIFALLERHNRKATFFVLGWIGEKYPEIVRRICDNGYEIGFHTSCHQLIHRQRPETFRRELAEGLDRLENIAGMKVRAFRAPGFSLTESCRWAFEILVESGIEYDSSVFLAAHAHGGYPSFPSDRPAIIRTDAGELKEFPVVAGKLMGKAVMYSGGGYFRLYPYRMIKHLSERNPYVMAYLHPRDMDAGQPVIEGLSPARRFKSYVGVRSCAGKFESWIRDFEFTDISTADGWVDWSEAAVFDVGGWSEPGFP